jgi:hypothetical protein
MALKNLMRALCGAYTATLLLAGAAQAALLDRDLDGNGVTDAFYDTDLNITWLRDATPGGGPNWESTLLWAESFSFAGYKDWRLPTGGPDGEIGHLWFTELGNVPGQQPVRRGDFEKCCWAVVWTGTERLEDPSQAWFFSTSYGQNSWGPKSLPWGAMIVRDGDVTPVPEPGTYALMLLGLAGLAAARSRR